MKTKPNATVFDVRLSTPITRTIPQPQGGTKEWIAKENVHLIVVADSLGKASELALAEYPNGSIWQINSHGVASQIIVEDSLVDTYNA